MGQRLALSCGLGLMLFYYHNLALRKIYPEIPPRDWRQFYEEHGVDWKAEADFRKGK